MKKLNLFLMVAMLGFWINVQNVQAVGDTTITSAPNLIGGAAAGADHNGRIAIAPYAQVTAGESYTFIGISHPSVATAHTSIGVVVEAMDMVTVPDNAAGRAAVFTVSAGETHRVFIVNQSHATINSNNASFTDTQTHLITTSDADQFGNIRVVGVGTHPALKTPAEFRPGAYMDASNLAPLRHDNVSQLSMWGVVYQSSNGAGFALEFIGDMHDSSTAGNAAHFKAYGILPAQGAAKLYGGGGGRGIN